MPRQPLSSSIRATAAAGIAGCSLAGVSAPTQAETVWTPGPAEIIGSHTGYRENFENIIISTTPRVIDLDGDGLNEFYIYFGNYPADSGSPYASLRAS